MDGLMADVPHEHMSRVTAESHIQMKVLLTSCSQGLPKRGLPGLQRPAARCTPYRSP